MVEREAPGDFDYLWDDPAGVDGLTSHDAESEDQPAEESEDLLKGPVDDQWDDPDDNFWDNQPDVDDDPDHFDAFNDHSWSFTPAPTPWYRSKQAMTAIIAASTALAAIVVSGVLLVFRGADGRTDEQAPSSVTPTAPTSAAQMASSEAPPTEPLPPPPPPPETASPVTQAPRSNPVVESRATKAPEIGVTRTPVTRQPISVAPQPRGGRH